MEAKKMFLKTRPLSRLTGVSESYIRRGLRDGTIPYIRVGRDFLIPVQPFIDRLDDEARQQVRG